MTEQAFGKFERRRSLLCDKTCQTKQDRPAFASVQAARRTHIDMACGDTPSLKLFPQSQDDFGCTSGPARRAAIQAGFHTCEDPQGGLIIRHEMPPVAVRPGVCG